MNISTASKVNQNQVGIIVVAVEPWIPACVSESSTTQVRRFGSFHLHCFLTGGVLARALCLPKPRYDARGPTMEQGGAGVNRSPVRNFKVILTRLIIFIFLSARIIFSKSICKKYGFNRLFLNIKDEKK